ncbi:MAG TPA: competence protein TfoX [Bacteroidales bacterium]|nr:MAG: competence protein TfoX [Bacteroidetes bacterium GWF2_33_38]OFY75953.1 MAG: competence protein TfoX [Bacteroidetes bacterium RIFOXYA12_FULL_33_9]OFY86263.1 MAG: competence protein TfoX [Bacteroidetes bacterium RIFOXYA2_FULL_33_7]HBF88214.1 competence protein TfoX [Bacteroidales bacterium]
MTQLTDLPNIGKELAKKLVEVGIENAEALKSTGSERAFILISAIDSSACINMLYALEGAVQGIRWHQLSLERKQELKIFFNMLKKKN